MADTICCVVRAGFVNWTLGYQNSNWVQVTTTQRKTTIPLLPRGVKYFGLVVSDGEEPWGLMQTLIVGR